MKTESKLNRSSWFLWWPFTFSGTQDPRKCRKCIVFRILWPVLQKWGKCRENQAKYLILQFIAPDLRPRLSLPPRPGGSETDLFKKAGFPEVRWGGDMWSGIMNEGSKNFLAASELVSGWPTELGAAPESRLSLPLMGLLLDYLLLEWSLPLMR